MKSDKEFEYWKQEWQNMPGVGITFNFGELKRLRRTAARQAFRHRLLVIIVSALPLLLACAAFPLIFHLHRSETAACFACISALVLPAILWAWIIGRNRYQLTLSATSFIGEALRRSQTNLRAAMLGLGVTAGGLLFRAVWTFRIADRQNMLSLPDVPMFLALGFAVMLFAGLTVYQTRAQAEAGYLKKLQHDWSEDFDPAGLKSALDLMKNHADDRRIRNPLSRTIRSLYLAVVESIRPNGRRSFGKRRNKRRRLS
jgi:hypothetical protein